MLSLRALLPAILVGFVAAGGRTCGSAKAVAASVDLRNTVIVITGGDTGIGLATTTALAYAHASIVIGTHNLEHGSDTAHNLSAITGNPNIEAVAIDLANFSSVRTFAAQVLERHHVVDVLINNAGIDHAPHTLSPLTVDGFDRVFQTNYLGHFALTNLLIPALRRSSSGKVINVASGASYSSCSWASRAEDCMRSTDRWETIAHTSNGTTCPRALNSTGCPVCCSDVNGTNWNSIGAPASNYGITKFLAVVHAAQLARQESGVQAYSLRPGFVATPMTSNLPFSTKQAWCAPDPVQPGVCPISADHGAATQTYLAVAPARQLVNGEFYSECRVTSQPQSEGWDWKVSPSQFFNVSLKWIL